MTLSSNTAMNHEEKAYAEPAGLLLGKIGLLIMLAVLIVAAWFGQIIIVILTGLLLAAAGIARLWSRLSLVGVKCERSITESRLFPGEFTELKLRVVNRKLLPLPWLQVDDEIPVGLTSNVLLRPGKRAGYNSLSNTASLLWYTGINWRYRLQANQRGYYFLGPIQTTSGDIFGFYPRVMTQPAKEYVIVYPRLFPIKQLNLPSLYPVGETKAERRIFEDPTRTIGVRDYTFNDSLRHVHWKASARHQKLQVKVFEPTTTLKVALFLAVDSFQDNGTINRDNFELGISTIASIASYVTEQRSPVGLFVNSRLADSGQPALIPPGSSTTRLVDLLETLAKVTTVTTGSFEKFVEGERESLPWGTTAILVIAKPSESLPELLANLRNAGHKPLVFQVGETDGLEHTVPWHIIRRPDDLLELKESPSNRLRVNR
ncbi:MAG: DUF58 domain-containing protein [Chloroflexota bacterium]